MEHNLKIAQQGLKNKDLEVSKLREDRSKLEEMLKSEKGVAEKLGFEIATVSAICSKVKDSLEYYGKKVAEGTCFF